MINRPREMGAGAGFVLPLIFVVLYGSGFVGTKIGMDNAPPFEFLALRFTLAGGLLAVIAWALRAPWPRTRAEIFHVSIAGLLMIGVLSAGVFYSIALGVPPAVSALIIALQPIVVALGAGPLLGERTSPRQWFGLVLGLVGVFLVLSNRLFFSATYFNAVLLSVVALIGLAAGNLYQKKFCAGMNVFTGGAVQCISSTIAMLFGILIVGSGEVRWTTDLAISLFWMTAVVSVGAVTILYVMIRHGQVSRVASIFYLIPVSAALTAFFLFGQVPDAMALLGMIVAGVGIGMSIRQ